MPITAVIEKIEELIAQHQTLLELGERKREVLVKNEVNELAAIVQQENKWLKIVAETEGQWRAAIVHFLQSVGIRPTPSITTSDIIKLIHDATDRQRMQAAQQKLLATIEQMKQMNSRNQQLIEQSLAFIDYSLDLFMGDSGQQVTYRNPTKVGMNGADKRRGMFDTRA